MNTLQAHLIPLMDDAGCIPYKTAKAVSADYALVSDFLLEYGDRSQWDDGEPLWVDLGEFIVWLGYLMLREGSHPPMIHGMIPLFTTTEHHEQHQTPSLV
jgi:hypothetical protein